MSTKDIYEKLRKALKKEVQKHNLSGQKINIRCKALSAVQAIGRPDHDDYPIIKGKEVMVEAIFNKARGQAFTDEFENADYHIENILNMQLNTNKKRASFISALNAVFRHLELCDKTIHCKDNEPKTCANKLIETIEQGIKVLLVGYQPRFLEFLASNYKIRIVDLDKDNIGKNIFNTLVESPEMTSDAINWCDLIFATGSTLINGTIGKFLNQDKPVLFYGVTVSAPAKILNLKTYCQCGH
ncbi:Heavy-metal chelation domain-containing protein [Candidatus Magnetomoraceae bacterium gMMP-15]